MSRPGPDETLDELASGWRIFQLRRGHRYNTDDLLVACTAARARPDARRVLDLGAGVGSVGLITLALLAPDATLVAVEVQAVSAALARRSVRYNHLDARVEILEGDLREVDLQEKGHFDLITGNPPYLPPGTATASPVRQRAVARIELHGDVFDWCRVAASRLAPDGRFCFCHAAADPRPEAAIAAAGLSLTARLSVRFHANRPAALAVYTAAHSGTRQDPPELIVREHNGEFSRDYREIRRFIRVET